MRISRSEPRATLKRDRNAAPLRHKFSLDVSSSKATPRLSRPRTLRGRRTAILRSDRCLDASVLTGTMGQVLISCGTKLLGGIVIGGRRAADPRGGAALEEAFHAFEYLAGRFRRVNLLTKFAAVPHAMGKPASELLHFAYAIGLVRSFNFPVVAGK